MNSGVAELKMNAQQSTLKWIQNKYWNTSCAYIEILVSTSCCQVSFTLGLFFTRSCSHWNWHWIALPQSFQTQSKFVQSLNFPRAMLFGWTIAADWVTDDTLRSFKCSSPTILYPFPFPILLSASYFYDICGRFSQHFDDFNPLRPEWTFCLYFFHRHN